MRFELERQLIDYTHMVFDYFNGKVNNIPAKINIRNNKDKNILGNNMFNIVNLYLWNIIDNYWDEDSIKEHIIYNIVHELSHIGQDIDYYIYSIDNDYNKLKENENNYNTYKYLNDNINSISLDLGIVFNNTNIHNNYIYFSKYSNYKRFALEEYYKHCIKTMLYNDTNKDISQEVDLAFKIDSLSFVINHVEFPIKKYNVINQDVNGFNNIIEAYNNTNTSISSTIITQNYATICINSIVYLHYNFNIVQV